MCAGFFTVSQLVTYYKNLTEIALLVYLTLMNETFLISILN